MRTPWCCSYFSLSPRRIDDGVLDRRLRDEHGLEATGQRRVLLDVLAVLVERGRADAVQFAAGERGLQEVRGVHRAFGLAGADQRMHLVDEQDDAALGRRHLLENRFQALLELAAVFRAGDQRAHVKGEQLLVLEALRYVAVDDAQGKPFDDGGLADAGLADQHGIVLGAPRQHLDGAADFLIAPDHRVELAVAGRLGEIARIFLQRLVGVFGGGRVGGAPLAQAIDGGVQRGRGDAGAGENFRRLRVLLDRESQQQTLDGHKRVAGLVGRFLGGIEQTHQVARGLRLRGCAGDFRLLGDPGVDLAASLARVAAGPVDQPRGEALRIVQKSFQNVFGRELRVPLPHGDGLRRLQKAARTLGVAFEIHAIPLLACNALLEARRSCEDVPAADAAPDAGAQGRRLSSCSVAFWSHKGLPCAF